jgi:acetyltransferase-like isoleucine patch superfamily enzyme
MNVRVFFSELRLYLCNEWVSKVPSHAFRKWFYRKAMGFKIDNQANVFMHCSFDSTKGLKVGKLSVINANCRLDTRGGISIGRKVAIASDVIILTADHDVNSFNFLGRNREVVVDDYVWIGTRAMILPGVTIGYGAVIAAGAVVSRDVAPFSIVGGVPAKPIGRRNEELSYGEEVYCRLFQ